MGKVTSLEAAFKGLNIDSEFVLDEEHRPKVAGSAVPKVIFYDAAAVPVIDMAPFSTVSSEDGREFGPIQDTLVQQLVVEVGRACEEWGFFQVINHGVAEELLAGLKRESKAFFNQDLEEKRKVRRSFANHLGYYDEERTKNVRDWKEVFDYAARGSLELPDIPLESEEDSTATTVIANRWPNRPEGFRAALENWGVAVEALAFKLLALIALSLGLSPQKFHIFYEHHTAYIRLNHYPKCPAPDLALGVSRHKDSGALTVLVQDETGGLQVKRKDGEWIDVKPRGDAFVVNVGDCFQVWSNDKYKSVEHRAVVHSDKERYSFPLFFNPHHSTDIQPIPELLDAEHPPRYSKFNFGRYRKSRANTNFKVIENSIGHSIPNIQISAFAIS